MRRGLPPSSARASDLLRRAVPARGRRVVTRAAVETAEKDPLEDLKVGAAKLVISLLPNEGGLRWVGGLLPSKFKSTFDGLVTSYKKQMLLALNGDEESARA